MDAVAKYKFEAAPPVPPILEELTIASPESKAKLSLVPGLPHHNPINPPGVPCLPVALTCSQAPPLPKLTGAPNPVFPRVGEKPLKYSPPW